MKKLTTAITRINSCRNLLDTSFYFYLTLYNISILNHSYQHKELFVRKKTPNQQTLGTFIFLPLLIWDCYRNTDLMGVSSRFHKRFFNHRHSPLSFCLTFNRFHLRGYNIYDGDITLDIRRVQSTFHIELFNKATVSKVTFLRSPSKLLAEPRKQSRPSESQASVPSLCHPASHIINAQPKYTLVAIDLMPLVSDS